MRRSNVDHGYTPMEKFITIITILNSSSFIFSQIIKYLMKFIKKSVDIYYIKYVL